MANTVIIAKGSQYTVKDAFSISGRLFIPGDIVYITKQELVKPNYHLFYCRALIATMGENEVKKLLEVLE